MDASEVGVRRPLKKTETDASNELQSQSPAPKRQRVKAKLSSLPYLPLDILHEIFWHLHPLDLLHLARLTKSFRRVLLARHAISFWKNALKGVEGLPECPTDLSEPAYANLAFDAHCHNCLTTGVRNVDWKLRLRLCVKCSRTCLISDDNFSEKTQVVKSCIMFSKWPNRSQNMKYCTVKSRDEFLQQYKDLMSDQGGQDQFVARKKEAKELIRTHAKQCERWFERLQDERTEELDDLRKRRRQEVERRLRLMGWGDELNLMPREHTTYTFGMCLFHEQPLIRQPKLLTDRSWKNMEREMVDFMESMKDFRLKREKVAVRQMRRTYATDALRLFTQSVRETRSLGPLDTPGLPFPGPADFWEMDPVKWLIESADDTGTRGDFKNFFDDGSRMHRFIEGWQLHCAEQMFKILNLPRELTCAGSMTAQALHNMQLAISVIECKNVFCCNDWEEQEKPYRYMYYPQYLHHRCNSMRWKSDPDDSHASLALGVGYTSHPSDVVRQPWSAERLVFDKNASKVIMKILGACGLSWRSTTVKQLDELDPKIVCLKCTHGRCNGERLATVRSWRGAVVHCMKVHWGSALVEWEMISTLDAEKARTQINNSKDRNPDPPTAEWRCTICFGAPNEPDKMTRLNLFKHLDYWHDLQEDDELLEGIAYIRALDVAPPPIPAIHMVPGATRKD